MQRISAFFVALLFTVTAQAQSGDPLTDCINATRAVYGLYPLSYDGNLAAWAAVNNTYGFGHTVMGPAARQNAAWGQPDCQSVVAAWMGSGGHRAALLDATITTSGGSVDSRGIWTWNGGYTTVTPTNYVVQTPQAPQKAPPVPQKGMPPPPLKGTPQAVYPTMQVPCATPQYGTYRMSVKHKVRWRFRGCCR